MIPKDVYELGDHYRYRYIKIITLFIYILHQRRNCYLFINLLLTIFKQRFLSIKQKFFVCFTMLDRYSKFIIFLRRTICIMLSNLIFKLSSVALLEYCHEFYHSISLFSV